MRVQFHANRQADLTMNSYIFTFHVNKLTHLSQLLRMYSNSMPTKKPIWKWIMHSNSMQTNRPIWINYFLCFPLSCEQKSHSTMTFYVFQFHENKQAQLNQLLCLPIPCKQTGPFESTTSYVLQFHTTNKPIWMNYFICITIPCKQTNPFESNTSYIFQFLAANLHFFYTALLFLPNKYSLLYHQPTN